jgi:hypothetical protein
MLVLLVFVGMDSIGGDRHTAVAQDWMLFSRRPFDRRDAMRCNAFRPPPR